MYLFFALIVIGPIAVARWSSLDELLADRRTLADGPKGGGISIGAKARVAQVKVDPQSGVCLASSRNANAVSSIGRNPMTNSAGVLAPTTATKPAGTAARL